MIKKHEVKIAAIINTAKKYLDELSTLRSATDEVLDRIRNEELMADTSKNADVIRALDEASVSISSAESALGTALAFLRVALEGDVLETVDAGKKRGQAGKHRAPALSNASARSGGRPGKKEAATMK